LSLAAGIGEGAAAMGIELSPEAIEKMVAHLSLLEKWNRVHNLTAVREPAQMVSLHVLDSLSILPQVEGASTLLDVGTGAGLPGIPLAIARPGMRVTLLDVSHKKCAFLQQGKTELALDNVEVACELAESYMQDAKFDVVVSRAFAELADFVEQAKHLVAPGGRLLAMKGLYPFEEIARLPGTHRVAEVIELRVPSLEASRHVVRVEAA
jgi:16S rRNA (guanine527-N7)-methyltransferase